jgi:hypothetical protein
MDTLVNGAIVVNGALLSMLLALWLTWLCLRSLFWLMPLTGRPVANRVTRPIRVTSNERRQAA